MRTDKTNAIIILLLFAAVAVSYGSSLNSGFLWDDEFLVVQNPLIRAPLLSFSVFKQDIVNSSFRYTTYYRPLQILSYAVDYRIWRMSPFGFHLGNLLLHFLNGLLVFLLILSLTGKRIAALITSLLFVVHPLQAGAASYISGRAGLLFVFFGLLFFLAFIQYLRTGRMRFFAESMIALVLSLFSKEGALILPFMLPIVMYISAGKTPLKRYVWCLPAFGVAAIYSLVRLLVLGPAPILTSMNFVSLLTGYLGVLKEGVVLTFFPAGLHLRSFGLTADVGMVFVLLSALVVYGALRYFKDERRLLAGSLGLFIVSLAPAAVAFSAYGVFGEHWMYLPLVGLLLFVSLLLSALYEKGTLPVKIIASCAVLSAVIFFTSFTIAQGKYWQETGALSDRVLSFSKEDRSAAYFKSLKLAEEGSSAGALALMDEKAGGDPVALYLKGRLALSSGRIDEAEKDFNEALHLKKNYDDAYFGLAMVYFMKGQNDKGQNFLNRTLLINENHPEALIFSSKLLIAQGKAREAITFAQKLQRRDPYSYDALLALGDAYVAAGGFREGASLYIDATNLYPERPEAYYKLAIVFDASKDEKSASEWARKAISVSPDFEPALKLMQKIKNKE